MLKNKSGITLIALVITIIVLIILAGISINILMGENGILTRAKGTAEHYQISKKIENVQLALTAEMLGQNGDDRKVTIEGVLAEVRQSEGSNSVYAVKKYNGQTGVISSATGNTLFEGEVTFLFPEEITGGIGKGIAVKVDDKLNVVDGYVTEVESVESVVGNIEVQKARLELDVIWENGVPKVTYEETENANVTLEYYIEESNGNTTTTKSLTGKSGTITPTQDEKIALGNTIYVYAVSNGKESSVTSVTIDDTTAPTNVVVTVTGQTANSVTVSVTATEQHSGIAKYKYFIKPENGSYVTPIESTNNPYTFTGLTSNNYKIKVIAIDRANNESSESSEVTADLQGPTITSFAVTGDPTENSITVTVNASDSSGLASSGTYTYYKDGVVDGSATTSNTHTYESLTAETSYTLSVVVKDAKGNTTESSNVTGTTAAAQQVGSMKALTNSEIDALTNVDSTVKYNLKNSSSIKEVLTGGVPVPVGFDYKEGVSTMVPGLTGEDAKNYGVVVTDGNENEWVWIPVNSTESLSPYEIYKDTSSDGISIGKNEENKTGLEIARSLDGLKIASINGLKGLQVAETATGSGVSVITYYYGREILSGYSRSYPGDTNSYREPDIVYYDYDSSEKAGFNDAQDMAEKMVADYEAMIVSIKKYGGFYVGRYELSGSKSSPTVKSNQTQLDYIDWYDAYSACRQFGTSYTTSTMMWGTQWDIMCLYCQDSGQQISYSDYDPSRHSGSYNTKTGMQENDRRNNIYDVEGSRYEWTQEASDISGYRVLRGGDFSGDDVDYAADRISYYPYGSDGGGGVRPTLYIR